MPEEKSDDTEASCSTEVACSSQTSQETSVDQNEGLKLRRKDLIFNDPVIVAVKDNGKTSQRTHNKVIKQNFFSLRSLH